MTAPEHQDLALIERTMENLAFIDACKHERGVHEVTQIINSFLSIVAHPRERLLDPEKLNWLLLSDPQVAESGLPPMSSSWEFDLEEPRTLGHLLRLLRNGIAHGGVEILDARELQDRRPGASVPHALTETDIVAVEIWNTDRDRRTWGTILTVPEMTQALRAFRSLALDRELWKSSPSPKRGGRRPMPAPRQQRNGNRRPEST